MQLNLTEKQYATLVKLVYLGNWLANSHRTPDEELAEFSRVEDLVYAASAGCPGMEGIERYEDGSYGPTAAFEDAILPLIDDYDDGCFWSELSYRLACRDLCETVGEDAAKAMVSEERSDLIAGYEERYMREFVDHGLDNLRLVKI